MLPPRAYRYLIQGYAHANQFDKAQELFDQMRQDSRLNKDCAIYCGMMAAYSVAGQVCVVALRTSLLTFILGVAGQSS